MIWAEDKAFMCSSEAQGWGFINIFSPAQASGIHSRDRGSVDKDEAEPSRRLCELPGPRRFFWPFCF